MRELSVNEVEAVSGGFRLNPFVAGAAAGTGAVLGAAGAASLGADIGGTIDAVLGGPVGYVLGASAGAIGGFSIYYTARLISQ